MKKEKKSWEDRLGEFCEFCNRPYKTLEIFRSLVSKKLKEDKKVIVVPQKIEEKTEIPDEVFLPRQDRSNIRIIVYVVMFAVHSLIGMMLLSLILNPELWQLPLLMLPGAGLYVALVVSTYKEVLENNALGRTIFGWSVGWAEAGPAFKDPYLEKFMSPIMEGTDNGATLHTKIFPVELYSKEFEETVKQEAMSSYKISTLEVDKGKFMGLGIDAVFWLKIAEYAKTKEEKYDAYYKAVFDVGGKFKERLKSISESHTRAVYSLMTLEEAISTEGKNLWEEKKFSDPRDNAEKAFKDAGIGILTSKGMVIEALGVPGIVEIGTQKRKEDELLGEGDRLRFKGGVETNLLSLIKNGFSQEFAGNIVTSEEQINSLQYLKTPKFFLGNYPGSMLPNTPNTKEAENPLMPKTVIDVTKEDGEENEEDDGKPDSSEDQTNI